MTSAIGDKQTGPETDRQRKGHTDVAVVWSMVLLQTGKQECC